MTCVQVSQACLYLYLHSKCVTNSCFTCLSCINRLQLKFNIFYEIRNYALSSQASFLLTNKPHVQCISSPVRLKTATVPWPTDNFPFLKRFVQWKFCRSDKGENFAVMVRSPTLCVTHILQKKACKCRWNN